MTLLEAYRNTLNATDVGMTLQVGKANSELGIMLAKYAVDEAIL